MEIATGISGCAFLIPADRGLLRILPPAIDGTELVRSGIFFRNASPRALCADPNLDAVERVPRLFGVAEVRVETEAGMRRRPRSCPSRDGVRGDAPANFEARARAAGRGRRATETKTPPSIPAANRDAAHLPLREVFLRRSTTAHVLLIVAAYGVLWKPDCSLILESADAGR